ncbi:MAG TPA: tetratricopeptide repeat protein [Gemmatimonadales bacterium]|nr:tetratricopeptide repeat protein [Gemmatimonadales bacterium]
MRLIRLAPIAAVLLVAAAPLGAQIPSGARRLGAPAVAAPKLMVATPFAFVEGDSTFAVEVGNAIRSRMERVSGNTYRVVPQEQMQSALVQYGYPPDAILPAVVARVLAQQLQARVLLASSLGKNDAGVYVVTSRLAGVNDDAGNVLVTRQVPGQSAKQFGEAIADGFSPAVKSADDAKACVDQRTSKPDKAAEAARKAIAILPTNGLAQFCLAQLAIDRKAPADTVIASLQQAVKGDPQSLPAWTTLAKEYETRASQATVAAEAKADSAKVIDAFQRMLLAAPTNQPLRETAFKLFLQYGRPDAAVQVAQEGLKLDPSNADLWDLLSNAYATGGDYTKAIEALEHVYLEAPDRADSTYFLKVTVFAGVQPDTAALLKWARLGVNKFPDNTTLLGQLVTAYSLAGPTDSLVAVTSRLMALDSSAVGPALAAAKALAEQKRISEALVFAEFVIAHGDAQAKEGAAAVLTNGALPLLQAEGQNLPLAADVLRRAVAAADPAGRVAPTANYVLGLATFLQIPAVDKDAEFNKSCELARKEEGLLTEAEAAFRLGQSAKPEDVAKYLGYVAQYKPRIASMIKAYCK